MNAEKRIAVVTGANRGIGFEICRRLAGLGIHVVLTSRDENKGKAAFKKLEGENLPVRYHQLDVTDGNSISRLENFLQHEFGRLDILINNAGIFLDNSVSIFDVELHVVHKTMDTNVYGPLQLCKVLIPLMRSNAYGRIGLTNSTTAS